MNTEKIKKIIAPGCTITITTRPDDIGPEDHLDESLVDEIRKQMEYSEWAWCIVTVTATWKGLRSQAHLGGCSYENEEAFRVCDHFEDMKEEAIAEVASQAERVLFNLTLGPAAPNGLEPNEVFDSVYLDNWLKERGWIHD